MFSKLDTEVQYLKGVGPRRAELLLKLNIKTIEDVLYFFARIHEDRSNFVKIKELAFDNDEIQTIRAKVISVTSRKIRRNLSMLKILLSDGTGLLNIVYFNQDFLKKLFKKDSECVVSGKVENKFGLQMQRPVYEFLSDEDDNALHTGRIVPIYSLTEGISQRMLRIMISSVLDNCLVFIEENLDESLREKYKLISKRQAVFNIHFPENLEMLEQARRRLIFEEFFILQTGIAMKKKSIVVEKHGIENFDKKELTNKFLSNLPFTLTSAQERVIEEITQDMCSNKIMHRLVQGDVGSGKTIVAVYSLLLSVENGYQAVLMAPTEILAEQHFIVLEKLFKDLDVSIAILTGGQSKKLKKEILENIEQGKINIIVGTHALIEDTVLFKNLGLVIIDEQHKFGVAQRAKLKDKGNNPDMLIMTATPIPRTLSMTVYGDLDVSIIDEMPKGRKPISTYLINDKKKKKLYKFVSDQIKEGRQAYFVYPLIEESEKIDLKPAVKFWEHLKKEITSAEIGLLHGRMTSGEKDDIMLDFKEKRIDVLVSTTVIEVGIDVPNATVMVIEDANRFGLAQLHQLRGRVGRGEYQSYCILVCVPKTEESKKRMKVMVETCDGFKIAEEDLIIRGPGEFFGAKQHGMPELRIGSLITDIKIMECARKEAFAMVNNSEMSSGNKYVLKLMSDVRRRYKGRITLAGVG
jgi:ATP-dependent DNA helicase RecG